MRVEELKRIRTSSENEIVRLVLLADQPHALNIITSMSPITLCVQVTEVEAVLFAETDFGYSSRNLSGNKGSSTSRRFVIEEDTIAGMHAIGFACVAH